LKSFKNHPLANQAEELSQRIKAVNYHSIEFDASLTQTGKWVKDAFEIERAETQSDRILEVKKQGNSETFPYGDPE
jgi:hypothetical protein